MNSVNTNTYLSLHLYWTRVLFKGLVFDSDLQIREASRRCIYVCIHDESFGHDSSFRVSPQMLLIHDQFVLLKLLLRYRHWFRSYYRFLLLFGLSS